VEIIVFREGPFRPYPSWQQIDLALLEMKIADSPEDYVFLLTTREWNEWFNIFATFRKRLLGAKTFNGKLEFLNNFAKDNTSNPISLICLLSIHPQVCNFYKLGNLTPSTLGNCYAIFFVKEKQAIERSEEIRRKISQFRRKQTNKPPLS
jgi:hypothetical protein